MTSISINQFASNLQGFVKKSFIYGFVAVVASFISCMEKAIAETPKTTNGQAAISGTWQLTPQKPQVYMAVPMPPLKIIITEEGKLYVQDPLHQNEYTEVGVIQKTSENTALPANAKILNPYSSPNRARQSEGKTYTVSMNRAQQAHFLERASWSNNIQGLEIGLGSENESYRYSIKIEPAIATLKTKPYPGIAINMGIAKQAGLKSYVGIVYVQHSTSSSDITSYSILCESNQPTMKTPSPPKWNGKEMICPEGYTAINR